MRSSCDPVAGVGSATAVDRDLVVSVLDGIVDPCSVPAGAPGGLVEMGIVREIFISGEPTAVSVRVVLCVTEPGCVMGGPFAQETHDRLSRLPGVAAVAVEFDPTVEWTRADMSPAYAERLRLARERRIAGHRARGRDVPVLPIPTVR